MIAHNYVHRSQAGSLRFRCTPHARTNPPSNSTVTGRHARGHCFLNYDSLHRSSLNNPGPHNPIDSSRSGWYYSPNDFSSMTSA